MGLFLSHTKSLSERCFFEVPHHNMWELPGEIVSYIPTLGFRTLRDMGETIVEFQTDLDIQVTVLKTDSIATVIFKNMCRYFIYIPFTIGASVVYLGMSAFVYGICAPIDVMGVFLRVLAIRNEKCLVHNRCDIKAPLEEVWKYATDMSKIGEWSLYMDHAKQHPLTLAPAGEKGSIRTLYRKSDETGIQWDEEFKEVRERFRGIEIRNLRGFNGLINPVMKLTEHKFEEHYFHHQKETGLVFKTFLKEPETFSQKLLFPILKIAYLYSRQEIKRICMANLENIKARVEGKDRVHAYEVNHSSD